jgi:hypothetical protein
MSCAVDKRGFRIFSRNRLEEGMNDNEVIPERPTTGNKVSPRIDEIEILQQSIIRRHRPVNGDHHNKERQRIQELFDFEIVSRHRVRKEGRGHNAQKGCAYRINYGIGEHREKSDFTDFELLERLHVVTKMRGICNLDHVHIERSAVRTKRGIDRKRKRQ